ncbi:heterokaryon incompatibility protein-domain-containing protein [Podospora aff. communis PSN243]|uniref:Heterokaryon incompatibility protein-domain-containing protein n=1 Tax=Podospora aff. communis PSN243 TaxID=3040156 RepID=A0AAV9GGS9_9PEZI|nr:heterokaryon incompatibility protein-domain-containing protein [Podospora aff. communis PSN243]
MLYQPISHPQSFRILEILPARKSSSQLRCRLKTVTLGGGDGPYSALSYTWGDTEPRHKVICNRCALEITPNLHGALLRLRHRTRTVTIWADQICINQKDVAERSQQVQLMRDIYSQAEEVLVWLGGDDAAEDETWKGSHISLEMAVQRIKLLSEEHVREHYGLLQLTHYDYYTCEPKYGWTTEGFTGEYYHWHKENRMGAAESPAWDVLRFFFSRPWFSRIWVIQELAVSRSVKLLLGSHELSWEDVENAANYADIHEYGEMLNTALACGVHLHRLLEAAAIPTRTCLSVASIRKKVQRDPQSLRNNLLDLLELTRSSQATDPRDRIIALLGLCSGIDITPDYTIPAETLFHTTTIQLIRTTQTLDALSQVFHTSSPSTSTLPSWVPNFTDSSRPPSLLSPRSHASPSPTPSPTIPISFPTPLTLHLPTVYPLAPITSLSDPLTPSHFDIQNHPLSTSLFTTFTSLARPLKRYRNGDTVIKAFFHCLVAGYIEFAPWAPVQSPEVMHHDYTHFYLRLMHKITGVGMVPWNNRSSETYARAARLKTRGRRVLLTGEVPLGRAKEEESTAGRSGRLLGLGPGVAEVGDWVVVVEGGRVPFVVRKVEGEEERWRLVGECYVHGMMDGEVAQVEGVKAESMVLV